MTRLAAWFQANPVLYAVAAGVGIVLALLLVFILMFRQSGQSLRPLVYFFGFLVLVGGPQLIYHLATLKAPAASGAAAAVAAPAAVSPSGLALFDHREGAFLHRPALFGADVEPALVRDARGIFPEFLAAAEVAEIAMYPSGASVLAARFPTPEAAVAALRGYLATFRVDMAGGDLLRGLRVTRGSVGDRAHLRLAGPVFMAWSGPDDALLEHRLAAADPLGMGVPGTAAPSSAAGFHVDPRLRDPRFLAWMAVNLLLVVLWFFKGAIWATTVPPEAGTTPVAASQLAARLTAVNQAGVPLRVAVSPDGREITVDWHYADARWLDHARAHRLRRTHRLVLRLDEVSHTVRVREYWSALEASAGLEGARLEWHAATGIPFFQYQHERVFGLQFDARGRPQPNLSYAYTFDLQELKQPLIQAVTRAGWTWKPLLFDVPAGLRGWME